MVTTMPLRKPFAIVLKLQFCLPVVRKNLENSNINMPAIMMLAPTITHCETFGQNITCAPVINKLINASGSRHFQANPMTWSMRNRGNVARTQIITANTAKTFIGTRLRVKSAANRMGRASRSGIM